MKLPYGDRTNFQQIIRKLETYALDFKHSTGMHKASLFRAKLGITVENKEVLALALTKNAIEGEALLTKTSQYGNHYSLDFWMTTNVGTSKIRSAWIVKHLEQYPQLTSVYPIKTKGEIYD